MKPMTVSLVGLPGSGKTTLCRPLATHFGFKPFILGDGLRQRSISDADLRASLARGELAPEGLVLDLVREAASNATHQGLVLDGFPRHSGQLPFAAATFHSWRILWLDTDVEVAASRLRLRRICGYCGFVSTPNSDAAACSNCGACNWKRRAEDESSALLARLERFRELLASMLDEVQGVRVYRIDSTQSVTSVMNQAVSNLTA